LGVAKNAVQVLEDAGGCFEYIALVDILNGFRHDGRCDAGNRQVAKCGIDVALECSCRLSVVACAPFFLLHGQPSLSDRLEGVVFTGGISSPVYPTFCYGVFVFEQQRFDLAQLDPRSSE